VQAIETSEALDPSETGDRARGPALMDSPVLGVDFDRAVLRADPLHEKLLLALKARPLSVPGLLVAATRGRDALHEAASRETRDDFQIASCPRRPEVEALVEGARRTGRNVVWLSREDLARQATGTDLALLIDPDADIIRPERSPEVQAESMGVRYREGYAYVGRSEADLPLWRAARERFGVDLSPALRRRAVAEGLGIVELSQRSSLSRAAIRSMRPHQWLKNFLVLVPFALNVGQLHVGDLGVALVAFACLCALTSGTYVVNDLFDVDADRRHPRKRARPIANGDLPIVWAVPISAALIVAAIACACLLRYAFAAALGSYLVITLAYSFRLKKLAMVDVLVIAVLFTLRILAGMLLVSEKPSHWLLMFSIFFFLSLAFMKREVEFNVMRQAGRSTLSGRGYDLDDRLYVLCCGLSSGIASVVIFALFTTATVERAPLTYATPELLWGVMGVLGYWVLRMWMLTTRGLMNDDPILFAARDRTSILLGAVCAMLAVGAQVLRL